MCENCNKLEAERQRLTEIALRNPRPCIVCDDAKIIGAGTWIPDERHQLAAGGTVQYPKIFAFCLCAIHAEPSKEIEKLVQQAVLRELRAKKNKE